MSLEQALKPLNHAREIFELLSDGRHLDSNQDAILWNALNSHIDQYTLLFAHLGQELVKNPRGYAYFEVSDTDAKGTRPLALLFLLIFQAQGDAGQDLQRFETWSLQGPFWETLRQKNLEILRSAKLENDEEWSKLLKRAERLGFLVREASVTRLLPATWRFLDLFLEIGQTEQADEYEATQPEEISPDFESEDEP